MIRITYTDQMIRITYTDQMIRMCYTNHITHVDHMIHMKPEQPRFLLLTNGITDSYLQFKRMETISLAKSCFTYQGNLKSREFSGRILCEGCSYFLQIRQPHVIYAF